MKYKVEFTELVTFTCSVEVEAESEEAAQELVERMGTDNYKNRDEMDAELTQFSFEELE